MIEKKYINKIKIGNIEISNNLFLAPMAGISDLTFRILCKEQGAGMVYTEMISAKGLYYNDRKTHVLLKVEKSERPVVLQIFGREPDIMGEVIKSIDLSSFDIIDLNFGCPSPKIVKNGEGSALMREPKLIGEIVKAVVSASPIPVTAKIRRGWDKTLENAVEVSKIVEASGCTAVTVHGRYAKQFYSGEADWDIIRKVRESVAIPVIGNGDVYNYETFKEIIDKTNCHAVMIGRASRGNPWIFNEIISEDSSNSYTKPTVLETKDLILRHFKMLIDIKGEYIAVREIRKHMSWYLKGIKNSAMIRNSIYKCDKMEDIVETLNIKLYGEN